ncbi:Elongation factor P [Paramicrosporidium saccamoebae]|uniref:Elongation factor P n=1 Tax=Paramicrosporidium saccamoebae TaxID=1246581 RepID=A0A2H9TNU7_9FUNG|nr:Elongation factor P [Paramicrosporidium saccamoebae]
MIRLLTQRLLPRSLLQRGLKVSVADLRKGDWIEHDGRVYVIHLASSTFSGRGAQLELQDVGHQFLYSVDGTGYYLNPKTLEEIAVPQRLLGGNLAKVIEGGAELIVVVSGKQTTVVIIQGGGKILCTGVLEVGDQIMINTDDLSYQGKALAAPL